MSIQSALKRRHPTRDSLGNGFKCSAFNEFFAMYRYAVV